jgi:hypothetical protein
MAGITHFEEFQKPVLRGLVDETVQDRENSLGDNFLPNRNVYSTEVAYDIVKTSKYIAPMIGFGSESPVVDRDAVARALRGESGKMGIKHIVTEEELLKLNQSRSEAENRGLIEALTMDGIRLVQAVQRRIDVMKMEALTKGTFSHNKNGVKINVDFGIPAEHKVAITGTGWKDPARDIIQDLLDYTAIYENTNGFMPETILISRQAFTLLTKNEGFIAESGREFARRASEADIQNTLDYHGLPRLTIVADRKVTVRNMYNDGSEVIEYMPENRLVFLSQGIGEYLVAPTVENGFEPGIVLMARDQDVPIMSTLEAVAAGFPAVQNPFLIFHADVYTV